MNTAKAALALALGMASCPASAQSTSTDLVCESFRQVGESVMALRFDGASKDRVLELLGDGIWLQDIAALAYETWGSIPEVENERAALVDEFGGQAHAYCLGAYSQ